MALILIVAYDIHDDRRRARTAATLQQWGDRVQLSVFRIVLPDEAALNELVGELSASLLSHVDSLLLLRRCNECATADIAVGQAHHAPPPAYWALV